MLSFVAYFETLLQLIYIDLARAKSETPVNKFII